jgi:hypothetical protein
VRRQATYFANSTSPSQPLPLIAGVMDLQEPGDRSARPPIRVDDGTGEGRSANPRELSPAGRSRGTRRPQERSFFLSQPRSASPESIFACSGWCDLDDNPYPTVVSLIPCIFDAGSGLNPLGSSLYLPARICSAPGKVQMGHSPRSCAIT